MFSCIVLVEQIEMNSDFKLLLSMLNGNMDILHYNTANYYGNNHNAGTYPIYFQEQQEPCSALPITKLQI